MADKKMEVKVMGEVQDTLLLGEGGERPPFC
jgi:hypothetical protein